MRRSGTSSHVSSPKASSTTGPFADHTTRIKRLFVELHEYSFFHNPSEIGNVDERFIAREAIGAKLRTILTSHETKSGSYLVTGYRGVGKSSLVARVLSDISTAGLRTPRTSRYFRIFFPLPFLALLDVFGSDLSRALFVVVPILFLAFSIRTLYFRDPDRYDLLEGLRTHRREPRRHRRALGKRLRSAFRMSRERYPDRRHRTLIQDFVFLSLIQILALCSFWGFEWFTGTRLVLPLRLATYLALYLALVLVTSVSSAEMPGRRPPARERKLRSILDEYRRRIRNYINFSHRFYVNINLGQDKIQEIDILRLIARSIYTRYSGFRRFGVTDLWWRLLCIVVIYFGVGVVYYYQPVYSLNVGAKEATGTFFYFPSQIAGLKDAGPENLMQLFDAATKDDSLDLRDFWEKLADEGMPGDGASALPQAPEWLQAGARDTAEILGQRSLSLRRSVLLVTNHLDLFVFRLYRGALAALPLPSTWFLGGTDEGNFNQVETVLIKELRLHRDFSFIPKYPDYYFLVYLFLGWLGLRLTARLRPFGIVTHDAVLRQLRDLNDGIDAQITRGDSVSGTAASGRLGFLLKRSTTKAYPMASVREIEKRLIEILDEIDRIPRVTVRPNFIFIFDELDKIEPHKNVTLATEEEEKDASLRHPTREDAWSSYGATRERQHLVLNLLSNLKHFFTTAKAKFIFIAGREMYDASLADVSDRHFFMGSIFNEVLYVPSFLRDPSDRKLADVTSLTERYVCQFLLPGDYLSPDQEPSLTQYNRYLRNEIFPEGDPDGGVTPTTRSELPRLKREKVIHELYNFIVYLTYRSNGAPKKITRLLESYITRPPKAELSDRTRNLVAGRSSGSLYLELGFYDQYTFGLVSYLAQPLFLSLHRSNKDFGDKLLVSASFLLDHLYKFHGFGFSWRHLELLPEIVDINKAPELRELIDQILEFLGKTHLEQILSGLHGFKFRKKITEEISYLSKISESESAAFNFTLDESLPIKQYYNHKLQVLQSLHGADMKRGKESSFIHSIAFVRMVLGDLHFYDQEFDQAILEYMEAAQALQRIDLAKLDTRRLVLLLRNLLKLGLTFEKKKSYHSAFVLYGRLTEAVIQARSVELEEVGLRESLINDELHLFPAEDAHLRTPEEPLTEMGSLSTRTRLNEALVKLDFGPAVERIFLKEATFEGIHILYQPLLAKLQIVEKSGFGGISPWDIQRCQSEFEFLVKMLDRRTHAVVEAEFKNKVGDILFYKNGPAHEQMKVLSRNRKSGALDIYCHRDGAMCSRNAHAEKLWGDGHRTPCTACRFTMEGLEQLCDATVPPTDESTDKRSRESLLIFRLFDALQRDSSFVNQRVSVLQELANLLSDAGDGFLSCADPRQEAEVPRNEFLHQALRLISLRPRKEEEKPESALECLESLLPNAGFSKTEEAILYYILSAGCYKVAGEYKSHAHQLTKVLYVIREIVSCIGPRARETFNPKTMKSIEEELAQRIIRGIYRTYESTHRIEIEKLTAIFETEEKPGHLHELVHLNNLSMARELREVIVLLQEIKLAVCELQLGEGGSEDGAEAAAPAGGCRRPGFREHRFISPYGLVNSMYNRIHELRFRAKENYAILRELGGKYLLARDPGAVWSCCFLDPSKVESAPEMLRIEPPLRSEGQVIEHLITDSIFCFHEILRCLRIFGLSYMANHIMRAAAHEKLAAWCDGLYGYIKLAEKPGAPGYEDKRARERMQQRLIDLIGVADLVTLTPSYHKERALLNYRAALQTHSEGQAYRAILKDMHYLDDDFSDELTHFCAAVERYRIHSGVVWRAIVGLAEECEKTRVHDPERYFRGPKPALDIPSGTGR